MRQSQLGCRTYRQAPSQIQLPGQAMLLRAGYLEQVGHGLWAYTPLLQRTVQRLCDLIQERLSAAGFGLWGLPILHVLKTDQDTQVQGGLVLKEGRYYIGGTSLPVIHSLAGRRIQSHRDLPMYLLAVRQGFAQQPRPGMGLLYAREFTVLEAYTLDPDQSGLERSYQAWLKAMVDICQALCVPYRLIDSDPGLDGTFGQCLVGTVGYGDRPYLSCPGCGYGSTQDSARSRLDEYPQDQQPLPREDVLGEGLVSTEAVAGFLGIPLWKTTKTMILDADGRPVAVMVRGDCQVSMAKARRALGCKRLDLLPAAKVKELTGVDIGYLGPIGLPSDIQLIADRYVAGRVNFECGANRTNYHAINVNFGRDLPLPRLEDIKQAEPGHICHQCDSRLEGHNGLEIAHLRMLAPTDGLEYVDASGAKKQVFVGRYTIGISRLIGLVAEQHHDQAGLSWPIPVAPFIVHLIGLNLEDTDVNQACTRIYQRLLSDMIQVLYDDRPMQAGQKFADSDLLGIPIRLTVSKRSLAAGGLEWKHRSRPQATTVTLEQAISMVHEAIAGTRG